MALLAPDERDEATLGRLAANRAEEFSSCGKRSFEMRSVGTDCSNSENKRLNERQNANGT